MELKPLGNSTTWVSPIGLGTVKFGRTLGLKYPAPFTLPTDTQIQNLFVLAKTLGINVLDTAPAYGNSEERIGQLLPASERKDWVIITKVGEEFVEDKSYHNFTAEHTRFSIERSLKRLKTDYLDVVLVHSDGNDVYNIQHYGILECLNDLKQKGWIRHSGMSSKTVEGGLLALDHADVVMVTYNPLQTEEQPVIAKAHTLNKGVLIKKALASGHLDKLKHPNPLHYSLEFVFKEPGISSVIIGTLNPDHLKEVCANLS